MKHEDKFYGYLSMSFHFKDDDMCVKAAHDLAEIKLKADKDKIINVLSRNVANMYRSYILRVYSVTGKLTDKQIKDVENIIDRLATEIVEALEVEKW